MHRPLSQSSAVIAGPERDPVEKLPLVYALRHLFDVPHARVTPLFCERGTSHPLPTTTLSCNGALEHTGSLPNGATRAAGVSRRGGVLQIGASRICQLGKLRGVGGSAEDNRGALPSRRRHVSHI